MRLWSLHPCYLDRKGLLALWREALLAQAVLLGETKGYRHHPQLVRFKERTDAAALIADYLWAVHAEARSRGYRFDVGKIRRPWGGQQLEVTEGQLAHEWRQMLGKLAVRDPARHERLQSLVHPLPHPMFCVVPGPVAPWERQGD